MRAIRKHGLWGMIAVSALLLLMLGTDAAAADATPSGSPVVRTRALQPIPAASLPTENGVPVLPAWDGTPRTLVFETVAEPTPLIENVATIERPGEVQRLVIPSINLDSDVVRQGIEKVGGELHYGTPNLVVGQYGGFNPGEGENVVLAGHVGTRDGSGGHVFRELQQVQRGDRVEVYTAQGLQIYVVDEIRHVGGEAVEVMAPTNREQITLITCRLCNVDCERLVVVAVPQREDDALETVPLA